MRIDKLKRRLALCLAAALASLALPVGFAEGDWADSGDTQIMAEAADEAALEVELPGLSGIGEGEASDQEQPADEAQAPETEQGEQAGETEQQETADPADEEQPEQEPEQARPALADSALKLGVGEKYTLKLSDGASAKEVGAKFTSSKSSVASVNKSTGEVTARKKGTAKITMKAADGSSSTCKVTVQKAPSKVTLSAKTLTLGVGEEATLKAKLPKKTASNKLKFSSSKKAVVTVDADGHVVALKAGTATITVKTFNRKKATCKVTVKAAPKSVTFEESVVSMWNGDSLTVKPKLSKNSAGAWTLSSSDEDVVSVSGSKLNARALGSATITVTTYNGLTAYMSVEVCRKPVYRALLIGETKFPGTRMNNLPAANDVSLMKKMLKNTKGAAKVKWSVTTHTNRTADQIRKDIRSAFAQAQEGDVSLFYISTHGDDAQSFDEDFPEYAGYLMTYPNTEYTSYYERNTLTLVDLASWLKEVPGQVVVVIDSCGSGAAVYNADAESNSAAVSASAKSASNFSPADFNEAVVEAFGEQDRGVMAPGLDEGAFVIQNKFYVLTASAYQEASWTKGDKYSYFTKWLTDGIATKGSMPADANKNKLTTLDELYKYIKKRGSKQVFLSNGVKYKQHVQVYPSNSSFELFYRK